MASADLATWKDYLAFHQINHFAPNLSKAFVDQRFAFYGKALSGTPEQSVRWKRALAATNPALDQGFFFVLQEQPAEPRFGLDVGKEFGQAVAEWSDLSWRSLAQNQAELDGIVHIDLNRDLPNVQALDLPSEPAWHDAAGFGKKQSQGAHLAYITLQQPVRICIHGSDMLRGTH